MLTRRALKDGALFFRALLRQHGVKYIAPSDNSDELVVLIDHRQRPEPLTAKALCCFSERSFGGNCHHIIGHDFFNGVGVPELVDILAIEKPETGGIGVSDVSVRDDAD